MADFTIDAGLNFDATKAFAALRNIGAEMDKLFNGSKMPKLDLDNKPALDSVKKVGDEGEKAFKRISDENGRFVKSATESVGGLGAAFKFNQISQAISGLASSANQLTAPFTALDTATNQMKTLGTEAAAIAPHLRDAAISMSKELPFAAAELQTTMFDALASGVQGGEEGLKKFAATSAKLATGGGSTIGDATKLLAGNLNAYGKSAEEAAKFSDIFFNTVNFGVVSIPELSANLSNVIPTAAAAGVELENVGAALAVMTSKGIPAAQSTTKLNALLLEIQKPGASLAPILKAAGVSLDSLKKDDLPVTLEKINKALIKTGQTAVGAFSSSEASAAFNTLAGDIEGFKKTFDDVKNTTGSTDFAFGEMSNSIEVKLKGLQAATEAYLINGIDKVGKGFVFAAGAAAQLAPVIGTFAGIKSILPEGAVGQIGSVVTGLLTKLIPSLGVTDAATGVTSLSFSAMWTAATGGVILLVAGIAAVIAALVIAYQNVDSVRALFDKVGDAVVTFGEFVLTYISLPFQLLWETVLVIGDAIGELFSSGESGGEGFSNAMATLGQVVDGVKATIVGLTAGIKETVKIFGEVLDAAIHLDFGKAASLLADSGKRLGDAVSGGIKKSLSETRLDDAVKAMSDSTKESVTIKAKLDSINELPELQKSLEETQKKLQPLQVKVEAGQKLTAEEKKSFDELAKKASEVSGKINLVAPDAITGVKTLVASNGDLIRVYDTNKTKLDEITVKQKKAYGDEAVGEQKKYSDGLLKLNAVYESQKQQLVDLKKRIDAANARGDTKGAAELTGQYRDLQKQVKSTSDQITKGFTDGAKAGLLTEDATKKISGALGITANQATEAAAAMATISQQAVKAALDTKALGEAFANAKNNADTLGKGAALGAAGVENAYSELVEALAKARKLKTAQEQKDAETAAINNFNIQGKIQKEAFVKTFAEARELRNKELENQKKIQKDSAAESRSLDKIEQSTNLESIAKNAEAARKIASDDRVKDFENKRFDEERAVKLSLVSESEKAIQILEINQKYNALKIKEQIDFESKQKADASKFDANFESARKSRIDALNVTLLNSEKTTLDNINTEKGKALVKEFEDRQKANDEKYKLEVENSKKSIELIQDRISTTTAQEEKRLSDLNAAQLNSIKNQSAIEIQEAVNKTIAVNKATDALKSAYATNNPALIKIAEDERATAIREAIKTDAVVIALNDKMNFAISEQNRKSAESSALALREFAVSRIQDEGERERELRLIEVDKTFTKELEAAKGNERLKNAAYAKAALERYQIEKDFADSQKGLWGRTISSLSDAFSQFSSSISESIRKSFDEAAKAQKEIGDKAKSEYEKEGNDLTDSLKKQAISFNDFQDKVAAAARKFNDATKDLGKSFGRLFADGFKDAMQGVADSFRKTTDGLVGAYVQGAAKISDTNSALNDAVAARDKAKRDRNVEGEENANKTIIGLQGDLDKSTQDNANRANQAYAAMAAGLAASFGASIAEGKKNLGEYVIMTLDALEQLLPILSLQIFAKSIAENPLVGALLAAGLVGGLTIAFEALKAGIRSDQGHHDGGYTGDGHEWQEAGPVHKREVVLEARITDGQVGDLLDIRKMLQSGVKANELKKAYEFYKNPELSKLVINPSGKIENGNFDQLEKLLTHHKNFEIHPERFTVKTFEPQPFNYKQAATLNNDNVISELRALRGEVVSLRKENEKMVKAQEAMPDSFLGQMNVGVEFFHDESISARKKELDIRRKAVQS